MKMVIAFIKKNKFDEVMFALHKIEGLTGASSSEVHGFGRDRTKNVQNQESEISLDFAPQIRLEIACHSELVEHVIATIEKAAHTGLRHPVFRARANHACRSWFQKFRADRIYN
jgi:nitrogen regulatory protein PII